ncbi:Met-10+ like-protein-domain-containing protein [Cristinia sonorae]|uniref:tRNA (guanine(37)-N1)-methyltransferase n=1 Tax=Cristinia sonorae TaxID=1940300 RepID=A0A8K0UN65_9AGAR|nr:Met-10+ like-protein-domain-containing protein [Cristinia sonorae]
MSSSGTLQVKCPIHRLTAETVGTFDKEWFRTQVTVLAAKVPAHKAGLLMQAPALRKTLLDLPQIKRVIPCEDGSRLVLLRVTEKAALLPEAVTLFEQENIELSEHTLDLDYNFWTVEDIFQAVLPEDLLEGAPAGFATVGHISHLNLNDEYLPYKYIIGQVILDKLPTIRTVVNKLDNIDNKFRVFEMEVLAGENNFVVEQSESSCTFRFDFSQVYWNSRLHTEHARLVDTFKPEDVVADVFAGVGPFAVPAGKRGVAVLANDLNPKSYEYMVGNIKHNKVTELVRAYNEDGREFIRVAARRLLDEPLPPYKPHKSIRELKAERRSRNQQPSQLNPQVPSLPPRNKIDHFVMNLPDTAIEFLDAFRGILSSERIGGRDPTGVYRKEPSSMPMVHCYCFTRELEFDKAEEDIRQRVEKAMGAPLEGEVSLHAVRRVAPKKDMYCISFRLPVGVAFATT